MHVTNPRVIVEVLSPGTGEYDRGEKREHYQTLASLSDYVLVDPHDRAIEVFSRDASGAWSERRYGPGEQAVVASVGATLDVDELYDAAGVAR